jgi:hypothetical protein
VSANFHDALHHAQVPVERKAHPVETVSEQAPAGEPFSAQPYLPAQLNEENAATKKRDGRSARLD